MAYTTKKSLLEAIHKGDEVSWKEFYETYRPLVVFCGRKSCLSNAEVDDLLQGVMLKVFHAQKTFLYDRRRGRFRDYLGRIIQNTIIDVVRSRKDVPNVGLGQEKNGFDSFSELWEEEWHNHLLAQALELLREKVEENTFQAFEHYALNGRPPNEVAEFVGISLRNVYDAKARCMKILRKFMKQLAEEK